MSSPFPGMDPYLERRWQDVHQAVCTYARDQLNEQLARGLVARLAERLVVEAEELPPRAVYPDVRVVKEGDGPAQAVMTAAEPLPVPILLRLDHEPQTQPYIEIREIDKGRLITAIEFLSISNKRPGAGRRLYKAKQRELWKAGVNLVEVDLLRGGRRAFLVPQSAFPAGLPTDFYAAILRSEKPQVMELYPMSLRQRLPALRVPLRSTDGDVLLRLQPLIDMAYRNGRYEETDYTKDCAPPLTSVDAAWADQLLRQAARR